MGFGLGESLEQIPDVGLRLVEELLGGARLGEEGGERPDGGLGGSGGDGERGGLEDIAQRGARVLHVARGRKQVALEEFFETLSEEQRGSIRSVSMDMWRPFIEATRRFVPDAEDKIAFDRFHVARHLAEAVDKVRRNEHRQLLAQGDPTLTGSKYDWMRNPQNMSFRQRIAFAPLRHSALRTARAWAIKEHAAGLWSSVSRIWATKAWKRWLAWALRCRLEPVQAAARLVRDHLWGIVNAAVLRASNGPAEGLNSRIKTIKIRARGFRNEHRFIEAIYFHLGDLQPVPRRGDPTRYPLHQVKSRKQERRTKRRTG